MLNPAAPQPGRLRWLTQLPRETRDTVFVLAIIAWVVLPLTPQLPIWCSLLTAGVLLWRGWLAVHGKPLPTRKLGLSLPNWLLLLALAGVWLSHRTLLGRDAGVTLIVVLLALKTLELRARRDALVIFFLGFFTMLTNFFYSQSLLVALAMLLALLGLLTALVNAHRPAGQPSLKESAGMAVRMSLLGAPVMLALFVFFPRMAPLWGLPADANTGRTGLSSQMRVGAVAELAMDDGIALRVRFDSAPPLQSDLYFRGPVFTQFDGREWRARGGDAGFDIFGPPGPGDLQVRGAPIDYEITLEPSRRPWLLTLDVAPERPELPPNWRARMTAEMQWVTPRSVTDLLRYRARSYTDYRFGMHEWRIRPRAEMQDNLRLPAGFNPRTITLAEELRQQTGGDHVALVEAVLERLRSGGYTYTLEPGLMGEHTADEFWFDSKQGFCEHISSAFVVLLRAAGVPARIVTGFQGGERNAVDGYWVVRNSDAHAWAEVWLQDRGWVRIDPTAAVVPWRTGQLQRLQAPAGAVAAAVGRLSPELLAKVRGVWDAVNNRWNQWVLNYTQTRQFDLMRQLGLENPRWDDLARILIGLLLLGAALASLWAWWSRNQHDPWLRLLVQARQRLQALGLPDLPAQAPPRTLAAHVQASPLPEAQRQALQDWLLALERLRYAPARTTPGPSMRQLQRQLRQISQAVKAV